MIAMMPMHVRRVQTLCVRKRQRERVEVLFVQQCEPRGGWLLSQTSHLCESRSIDGKVHVRLKDTNCSIVPQDVHRPPCGHDIPYTALEYPNVCDHLVLHIDECDPCGVRVSDPIHRTRGCVGSEFPLSRTRSFRCSARRKGRGSRR